MSNFYLPLRTSDPRTLQLACKLVSSAYTYSSLHTTLSEVTTIGEPAYLTSTGATETGTIIYTPNNPLLNDTPTTGVANTIVIYQVGTDTLYAYADTDTIDINGATIRILIDQVTGLIQITEDLTTLEWTLQKYDEATVTDYNRTQGVATISALEDDFANTIGICTFTKFDTGVIVGVQPNPIIYDKQTNGTDYNIVASKSIIESVITNDSSPLGLCTFTKFATGIIYGFDRNPTVYDTTAEYDVTETVIAPNLIVTRATNGLSATIDCDNLPDGYSIKVFRGSQLRATKIPTTELIDLDAIDLPYTDAGLNATLNYKYYGKFITTGDINGVPSTAIGRQGQPRISIPQGAVI